MNQRDPADASGLEVVLAMSHDLRRARLCTGRGNGRLLGLHLGPCLDPKLHPKFHYAKRRFPITSKCRHIYGVLNVDEIKN
jgi:hypothetical protein